MDSSFGRCNKKGRKYFALEVYQVLSSALYDSFCQSVPELQKYSDYIIEQSTGEADLVIEVYETPKQITCRDGSKRNFYAVYVGEQWSDHRANWDWFYIEMDSKEVLWYNMIDDVYCTLDEWRDSEYYRDL